MDAAEGEIPRLVRAEKKPRVDGDTPPHSPTQAIAVTKVLDDDNLLREIIVRIGFPTTLVRAALVCKRWLGHACDPKFLSSFSKLHPPRLLGYYITEGPILWQALDSPRFFSMLPKTHPLDTLICRLESYKFGVDDIMQCRNGSVFTTHVGARSGELRVHRPLCGRKAMQLVPKLPSTQAHCVQMSSSLISEQEGSGLSYWYVLWEFTREAGKSMARVFLLQNGAWCMHASATCLHSLHASPKALLVQNKIYVPTEKSNKIIVLDLKAPTPSSFSAIQLPEGVKYHYFRSMLSREDADAASSVYLIHIEDCQLRVWLHKGNSWFLVNTICLYEMLDTLGISDSDHTLENEGTANVQIEQVGDNCQFVFLRMGHCIFYLDIKGREMRKVYEDTQTDRCIGIHPFMMMWPPTFPAPKANMQEMTCGEEGSL